MNLDDPKLTAFALGELDEPERSTIARAVAQSAEAQRYVQEIQELVGGLKNEFAAELADAESAPLASRSGVLQAAGYQRRRTGDRRSLSDIRDDPWFWAIGRPVAMAAAIAIFAVIAAIAIGTYKSRSDSNRSVAIEYAPIQGEQGPATVASEFTGPATVANPLRVEDIKRVEQVVIGELNVDPHLRNGELRLIEVINDAYRIQRLKDRLTVPVLSKRSHRTRTSRSYGVIFLDRRGQIIATARFYRQPDTGFVLQSVQNARGGKGRYFIGRGEAVPGDWKSDVDYSAYAIPFPDWSESVGYAPGA